MNSMKPLTFQGRWRVAPVVAERNDESYRNTIIAGFEQLPAEKDKLTFAEQIQQELPDSVQIDYRLLHGDDDYVEISLTSKADGQIHRDSMNRPLSPGNWFRGKKPFTERFQGLDKFLPEVIQKAKKMADKYQAQ